MVKIIYTKYALANRFDDCIELNKNLKKVPDLHNAILEHELGHKEDNSFRKDFLHDLTPIKKLSQKDLTFFILKHPSTLIQFLPFYWSFRRKQIIYDLNMIIIYGFMLLIISLGLILF
jgi:hypothetical protein